MGVREIAAVFMGINPDQNNIGLMMMRNEQATLKVVGLCPEATKQKLTETRMRNPKVNIHHHHYCLRLAVISARDKPLTESRGLV